MNLIAVVLAAFVAVASSYTAIEELAEGNLKFTADLYQEVLKLSPNKNFIFSPLSVQIILALTRAGAKGRTQQELTAGLHLPNPQRTDEAIRQLVPALKRNTDELKLLSANKLFLGEGFQILDDFKRLATTLYDADAENVDFGSAQVAAAKINQWVEQQTNNKIQNLISPDSLSSLTRLVLVNALYLSAKWETSFEQALTYKDKFYTSRSIFKEVDMMHLEDTFKYCECAKSNAKILELPYLGPNMTMTIVLPNDIEGLSLLETNLEKVLSASKNAEYQRVAITMPKWTVESTIPLKPILQKLGIIDLFSNSADLSGISNEGLKVDEVIQKAFINVTESGTEAAAATAVVVTDRISHSDGPYKFVADHPFSYIIKENDIVLFTGRLIA